MSNFVFICGGKGERFKDATPYKKPLPLIYGRHIFQWSIDSFKDHGGSLIVAHNDDFHGGCVYRKIREMYQPNFDIQSVLIPYQTRGPCETVYVSCKDHFASCPYDSFWVLDNDNIYDNTIDWKIVDTDDADIYIIVKTCNVEGELGGKSPFGHVILNTSDDVKSIVEKVNVSNTILVGAYGFRSWSTYEHLFHKMFAAHNHGQELFMSDLINMAIHDGFKVKVAFGENSHAIGTPQQVEETLSLGVIKPQQLRWIFDLDETLVTRPEVTGDYSTCRPIQNMIDFVNKLHDEGHYIIIHTARHMLTCNGDVRVITQRIGQKTEDSLYNMGVHYHELVFGKPYGDIYVDDKACNTYAMHDNNWCTSALGFGWTFTPPKDHHKIEKIANDTCLKTGTPSELEGYSYYLNNCGNDLVAYVPKLYKVCINDVGEVEKLIMEWKDGIVIGKMYMHGTMSLRIMDEIVRLQQTIHQSCLVKPDEASVFENYLPKLKQRMSQFESAYVNLPELDTDTYLDKLEMFFASYSPRICARIHGDFWLSNLLWQNDTTNIFMIDMRGRLGDQLHLGGDALYDFAKLYQSLIGFDHILHGRYYYLDPENELIKYFESYVVGCGINMNDVKAITFTLLLGSFPFHKELMAYRKDYVKMMQKLWDEIVIG